MSDWTITEVSAALSIKVRNRQIDHGQRAEALAEFNRLAFSSYHLAAITSAHFRSAARLADLHGTGLRAGDALHLAIAADLGATVWTLDRVMADAGPMIGVATHLA